MAKILILYTGGTIGMAGSPLAPMTAEAFRELLTSLPQFAGGKLAEPALAYDLVAFGEPLDSSAMVPRQWVDIARLLLKHYEDYLGFVVLHGTDSMAWTASALSFLLEGLSKPVIVTGSQIPLVFARNDGLENLITAMVLAGTAPQIQEVGLFFRSRLLRGNRATKVNASGFAAFDSPNYPPLATAGIAVHVDDPLLLTPPEPPPSSSLSDPANIERLLDRLAEIQERMGAFSAIQLPIYPGIAASTVAAIADATTPPVRGVVLQGLGAGNGPSEEAFIAALSRFNEAGATVVDVTQCLKGTVDLRAYAAAGGLVAAGAISGFDLTAEAALAKLIYLTARGDEPPAVKKFMQESLRGELTVPPG